MKNYNEVFSCGRGAGTDKSATIAFEASFRLLNVEDGINVFGEKAGLAIKYLPTGKKPLSGFIRRGELWKVYKRVDKALDMQAEREMNPAAATTEPPYVFKMGQGFKGKTPGQCLLEGMDEAQLLQQREYMARNLTGKFAEANRKGIEAIDKAIANFHNGKLSEENISSGCLTIFESGPRYIPRKGVPQPYQTDGWEMSVVFNAADRNPWSISWVSKSVTVADNVIVASENSVGASASLTDEEFLSGINEARELFGDVRLMNRPSRLTYFAAHKDDWKVN